jgi:heme exporter protein B
LTSSLVFALIVLVVFSFAFDLSTVRELGVERLVPGVVWTVLAFTSVIGVARSMLLERRQDTLGALFLSPIDRGALFGGKFLANLVKATVLELLLVPLSAVLFDYDLLSIAGPMLIVLMVHTVGLIALGTLFAALATRIGRGEALVATLLFPAATPLLISAVKSTEALLAGKGLGGETSWLRLSVGFDVLYVVVALFLFEFVLEE